MSTPPRIFDCGSKCWNLKCGISDVNSEHSCPNCGLNIPFVGDGLGEA